MLEGAPRALVWDDADAADPQAVAAVLTQVGPMLRRSRLIVLARTPPAVSVAVLELLPLSEAASRELLDALERARGVEIRDEVLRVASGNPLALQLAFGRLGDLAAGDLQEILERAAAETVTNASRAVLEVLLATPAPLPEALLYDVMPEARSTLARLRRLGMLVEQHRAVSLHRGAAQQLRASLGPEREVGAWTVLDAVATRALATAPGNADALLIGCDALLARGEPRAALAKLGDHGGARAAMQSALLERLVVGIARADASCASDARMLLARELMVRGDVEAAQRAIEPLEASDLSADAKARVDALRARILARGGEMARAQRAVASMPRGLLFPDVEIALELTRAMVDMFRAELNSARAHLRVLAARTQGSPDLEYQRAILLALSYFFEERFSRAAASARRARRRYGRTGVRASIGGVIEAIALLFLDEVDHAAALIDRQTDHLDLTDPEEPLREDFLVLFPVAVRARRGELEAFLAEIEPVFENLRERGDRGLSAIMARMIARAAMEVGRFEQAESLLRVATGVADESGFHMLKPACNRDAALLADARGEHDRARALIGAALAQLPGSSWIKVDAWALGAAAEPTGLEPSAGLRAYTALRGAERALRDGDVARARSDARDAIVHYGHRGMRLELARAYLAYGEAAARAGDIPDAREALDACDSVARPRGYAPIVAGALVVRAAIADRTGQLDAYAQTLEALVSRTETSSRVLSRALTRLDLPPLDAPGEMRWLDARLVRLGLDRPADRTFATHSAMYLQASGEPPPIDVGLLLDVDARRVLAKGRDVALTEQRVALLEMLILSGPRGVSLEELYAGALGGQAFHPLQHRNSVYVAMTRLRAVMRPLFGREAITEQGDGRYRLRPDLGCAATGRAEELRPSLLAARGAFSTMRSAGRWAAATSVQRAQRRTPTGGADLSPPDTLATRTA